MPRQNRVTPLGELIATKERGTFLGNRGVLHDAAGNVKRLWQVKRWIVCVLEFRGRQRAIMTPGHYTELFFLDEATALAAGHRPCAECRRVSFNAFCAAWAAAHGSQGRPGRPTVTEIDARLHAERIAPDRSKQMSTAALDELPDGVFIKGEASSDPPFLVQGKALFAWSPGGYVERRPRPGGTRVTVLTPPATVAAIRAGYTPVVHASAGPVPPRE